MKPIGQLPPDEEERQLRNMEPESIIGFDANGIFVRGTRG